MTHETWERQLIYDGTEQFSSPFSENNKRKAKDRRFSAYGGYIEEVKQNRFSRKTEDQNEVYCARLA